MARIRTIKPEFPISESMGRVGREARLLYVNLWTVVDDEGRARGSSRMLASLLYPYDDDAPAAMDGWLAELEREGCVRRYEVEGSNYIDLPNWLKHQKIDKPTKSRLPSFDEGSRVVAKSREVSPSDLGPWTLDQDRGSRTVESGPLVASRTPALDGIIDLPSEKKKRRRIKVQLPDDWKLTDEQWKYGAKLGLTGDQIEESARKLSRWVKREGKRCVDWNSFIEDWLGREVAYLQKGGRLAAGDDRAGFGEWASEGNHG